MRPLKVLSIAAQKAHTSSLLKNTNTRNPPSLFQIPFLCTLPTQFHHSIVPHVSSCNPTNAYYDSGSQKMLLNFGACLFARKLQPASGVGWLMGCREFSARPELEREACRIYSERSRSLGDKLVLRGLMFHGHHGVYDEEKKLGQKFLVDADIWLDLRKAGTTDQLEYSVSYEEIYRMIKKILEGPSHALLESVATAIAGDILKRFPAVTDVWVKVGKPHVAVEGLVDYLGVEIFRSNLV